MTIICTRIATEIFRDMSFGGKNIIHDVGEIRELHIEVVTTLVISQCEVSFLIIRRKRNFHN